MRDYVVAGISPHDNLIRRLRELIETGHVTTGQLRALLDWFESECDDEARAEEANYMGENT